MYAKHDRQTLDKQWLTCNNSECLSINRLLLMMILSPLTLEYQNKMLGPWGQVDLRVSYVADDSDSSLPSSVFLLKFVSRVSQNHPEKKI